jgi:hypothetical protein
MLREHRLSPSGLFIGDPGLNAGPGTIGLIWRAHGITTVLAVPTAAPVAIPGMGGTTATEFAVRMQAGYLYEIEVATDARQVSTANETAAYQLHYRLHDEASDTWGSWLAFTDGGNHWVDSSLVGETQAFNGDAMCWDARFGITVAAIVDAVQIGVQAPTRDTWILIVGEHCHAQVCEYLP